MASRSLAAWSFVASLPVALALAGCSGSTASSATAGIGASGGTLSASDGTALSVPSGALKVTEQLTLDETAVPSSAAGNLTPVGTAYAFGPDNLTFAKPVTVTVTVDVSELTALHDMMSDVSVFWQAPGQEWTILLATPKDSTHVTVTTTSPGTFVAGVAAQGPLDCGPGPDAG